MHAKTEASGKKASINITMADSSYYKGQTLIESGGQIDLNFKGGSVWENLAVTSTLTSARFETSQIIMKLDGTDTYSKLELTDFYGDASSTIKVVLGKDFNPVLGDEFQLVLSDGEILFDGTFDFSEAVLSKGLVWDTSTFNTDGTIRVFGTMPEPSAFALLSGAAVFGISASKRRRKAKA